VVEKICDFWALFGTRERTVRYAIVFGLGALLAAAAAPAGAAIVYQHSGLAGDTSDWTFNGDYGGLTNTGEYFPIGIGIPPVPSPVGGSLRGPYGTFVSPAQGYLVKFTFAGTILAAGGEPLTSFNFNSYTLTPGGDLILGGGSDCPGTLCASLPALTANGGHVFSYSFVAQASTTFSDDGPADGPVPGEQVSELDLTPIGSTMDVIVAPNSQGLHYSVVEFSLPEPGTWELAIGGFLMAGAALRARRRSSVPQG
jgi:hypothetical protein